MMRHLANASLRATAYTCETESERNVFVSIRTAAAAAFFAYCLLAGEREPVAAADPVPASSAAPVASPAPTPSPSPTPPVVFAGYADAGYTNIFGSNQARFVNGTASRVFDGVRVPTIGQANSFNAGSIGVSQLPSSVGSIAPQNLNLQVTYNGTWGGKAEFSIGNDADVIASNGTNHTDHVDPTQLYLQYANGPITFIAGKFSTLAGAEVIESPSNANFSRSFLFGLAVPFTHTGARLTWAANPKISLIGGVNNGWDDILFQGKNFTAEGGISLTASPAVSLTVQTYNGNDCVNFVNVYSCVPPFFNRMLYDTVLTIKATPALTLVANYDNGTQLGASLVNSTGAFVGTGAAHWAGTAGYLTYQLSPKYAATVRAESFSDRSGFRTGFAQTLSEGTATLAFTPAAAWLFRAEYRLDNSNQPVFFTNTGAGSKTQSSFGAEAVFKFP
jgi:hypothetical protein